MSGKRRWPYQYWSRAWVRCGRGERCAWTRVVQPSDCSSFWGGVVRVGPSLGSTPGSRPEAVRYAEVFRGNGRAAAAKGCRAKGIRVVREWDPTRAAGDSGRA